MSGQSGSASTYRERNSTADRALDILVMFTDQQPTVTGPLVADQLGVSRSTAYRYLQSLVGARFLEAGLRSAVDGERRPADLTDGGVGALSVPAGLRGDRRSG